MLLEKIDWKTQERVVSLIENYKKEVNKYPVDIEELVFLVEKLISKEKDDCYWIDVVFGWNISKGKGCVRPVVEGFEININLRFHYFSQRVTICHEIGHILYSYEFRYPKPKRILYHPIRSERILDSETFEEKLCDEIAMHLLCGRDETVKFLWKEFWLIPMQLELELFCKNSEETLRLKEMARFFEVSWQDLMKYIKAMYGYRKIKPLLSIFK